MTTRWIWFVGARPRDPGLGHHPIRTAMDGTSRVRMKKVQSGIANAVTLRSHVFYLRGLLGIPAALSAVPPGYVLDPGR